MSVQITSNKHLFIIAKYLKTKTRLLALGDVAEIAEKLCLLNHRSYSVRYNVFMDYDTVIYTRAAVNDLIQADESINNYSDLEIIKLLDFWYYQCNEASGKSDNIPTSEARLFLQVKLILDELRTKQVESMKEYKSIGWD